MSKAICVCSDPREACSNNCKNILQPHIDVGNVKTMVSITQGKLLTLIEAVIPDKEQQKAVKDLVREDLSHIWKELSRTELFVRPKNIETKDGSQYDHTKIELATNDKSLEVETTPTN